MTFYGSGNFYSDSNFYGVSPDSPIDLSYSYTDTDNVYVFSWTFNFPLFTPVLPTFDYELQLDMVSTFNSPSLLDYTSTSGIINAPGISYQDGNVYRGFIVPVYTRQAAPFTFYARVRIKYGSLTFGEWSDILLVTTLEDTTQQEVHNLISNLPDRHVYPYDEAYKTVTRTSSNLTTNLGKVYWAYAREFDNADLEAQLADNDSDIYRARDARFFEIWGYPTGFQKPSLMQYVDYRNIINKFRMASFLGSTVEAVKLVVSSFTGVDPDIIPFSQILNFITANEQVETFSIPSGPSTFTLGSLPRNCPAISGFTFTDGSVTAGMFSVNFSTGVITINSVSSQLITVTYVNAADIFSVLGNVVGPSTPVIYNRLAVGASVIITINNPVGFVIDINSVKFLLNQIIPSHIEYVLVVN